VFSLYSLRVRISFAKLNLNSLEIPLKHRIWQTRFLARLSPPFAYA